MKILSGPEVERLLPMAECVEVMSEALKTLASGDAVLPLRSMVRMPERPGIIGIMPAYLGRPALLGLKVVTVMPQNHGTEWESHQGAVMIFEVEHGAPVAVMDGSAITAIRTAAVSAVATRALARKDAGDLAILGSGVQAATHLEAMKTVRRLSRVRVWSRTPANARAFATREGERHGIRIEACASAADAVRGADLVCTTTASPEPVLLGDWLEPGAHVNAVGACFAAARELDTRAIARSRFYVDRRESALNEAGDFLIARREGAIGDDHIVGELGEVLIGRVPARQTDEEVTVFESLGIAIEDLAAAHHVHQRAVAEGAGIDVDLGGRRARAEARS